jgi:membrane protein DedA with SNARE-associated domain
VSSERGTAVLALGLALLGVLVGAAAVVAGESDDSPGLQGLGVLLVIGTVVLSVRWIRRRRARPRT